MRHRPRGWPAWAVVGALVLSVPAFAQDRDGSAAGDDAEIDAPSPYFSGRAAARLKLRGTSAGKPAQTAVDLALEWLKNHQSADGHWESSGFSKNCKLNKCPGPGHRVHNTGLTGGALLCFLGVGDTHASGPYRETVKKGLRHLKSVQDSEGCFGPRTAEKFQYNHALAALAMTEAYGLTGSAAFKGSAQRGVGFIKQSQNPYLAWRYGVRDGDCDTSMTGWAVTALKTAAAAELEVDRVGFKGALAWIEKMTEPEFGRVGYQRRGGPPVRTPEMMPRHPSHLSESLTGIGVLVRVLAGQDPTKSEAVKKGVELMREKPPRWDTDSGEIDFYYWYYGTLAMHQAAGKHWKPWNDSLKKALVENQWRQPGRDERGSWDPVGPWGDEGGRVYSTVMSTLCLEVEYRSPRAFKQRR